MKCSYYILISTLWLIGAWFVEGIFAKVSFMLMSLLWLIGYIYFSKQEFKLNDLQFKLDRLKSNTEELRHLQLLKAIAGKKKGRKK